MEQLKETVSGYVVASFSHPATDAPFLHSSTFRQYRKDCISEFVKGSGKGWKYWYRVYNYRCIKANQTVTTL